MPLGQSSPAPRRRLSRRERGDQLLNIAERLFAERGFEHTSIEDIARTAGVTRPVVYQHFATKEAVFLACVSRAREELERRLDELGGLVLRGGVTPDGIIERGGHVFFEILARDPRRWAVLFSPSSALADDLASDLTALRARTVERIAAVARYIAPGTDEERLYAYAHAVSGVGEQLGRWWLENPSVPIDRLVGYYRDFVMRGLSEHLPRAP